MLGKGTHLEKSDQERSRKGGWRAEWMKKILVGERMDVGLTAAEMEAKKMRIVNRTKCLEARHLKCLKANEMGKKARLFTAVPFFPIKLESVGE